MRLCKFILLLNNMNSDQECKFVYIPLLLFCYHDTQSCWVNVSTHYGIINSWRTPTFEPYLLSDASISSKDNMADVIKANTIAKVPWYTTPTWRAPPWKIHEKMTTSRQKLQHVSPKVSSRKTTKCHLCPRQCFTCVEENSMHGTL